MSDGQGEQVRLTMPATPQLLRVARLTAAGLASRLGFSFDEVEDLKIAVDELCFAMVGTRGGEGNLTLDYRLDGDGIIIEGTSDMPASPRADATGELSDLILSAVVDDYEVSSDDASMRFRLRKRRTARS
ncbi:MAG: anti-sigma factor [Actinobacteria bacterium]|nr:anti-sigma factor [Actinomycetota bacterium]